jgi:hypothetical protein
MTRLRLESCAGDSGLGIFSGFSKSWFLSRTMPDLKNFNLAILLRDRSVRPDYFEFHEMAQESINFSVSS